MITPLDSRKAKAFQLDVSSTRTPPCQHDKATTCGSTGSSRTHALNSARAYTVDGHGFFPVLVQVVHPESGTPVANAKVTLKGVGDYEEYNLDPKKQLKVLPETIGKTVKTDSRGTATVFYHGDWATVENEDQSSYHRQVSGTLVVEYEGKEIFNRTLEDWADENIRHLDAHSAFWIVVPLPKHAEGE